MFCDEWSQLLVITYMTLRRYNRREPVVKFAPSTPIGKFNLLACPIIFTIASHL